MPRKFASNFQGCSVVGKRAANANPEAGFRLTYGSGYKMQSRVPKLNIQVMGQEYRARRRGLNTQRDKPFDIKHLEEMLQFCLLGQL